MIAYFFIQNWFKCDCDYNHYSTVGFGNAWKTFWSKSMLCL